MSEDDKKLVYKPPFICFNHKFFTHDAAEFMTHLQVEPHNVTGNGECELCGLEIDYNIPYEGINEPVIVLCERCEKNPVAKETVRYNRRAMYPPEKSVQMKSF